MAATSHKRLARSGAVLKLLRKVAVEITPMRESLHASPPVTTLVIRIRTTGGRPD
ncbi:MAG: hypothetical protein ACYDHH_00295 [Solirubrobacteraceae bacterium]